MDAMLHSVYEELLPWATWPLSCPLGIYVTSPVSKPLLDVDQWESVGDDVCLNMIFDMMPLAI